MSSEITDRRGYELPDTYSNLQELWRGHYDHFNELLKQFLLQSYQEAEDRLELLEVGAGAKSVLPLCGPRTAGSHPTRLSGKSYSRGRLSGCRGGTF